MAYAEGNRKTKLKSEPKLFELDEDDNDTLEELERFITREANLPKNEWSCQEDIASLPLIKIGQSTLHYPCDENVCRKLIESCKPAPYGLGSETVIDKTVRDTWEIEGSKVEILSKPWLEMFGSSKSSGLLESIRTQLAPKCKAISAKLYKLLIYEKGSFFKAHKDSQREARHFASIVVFLPSYYTGGELCIRYGRKERSYSLSYSSEHTKTDVLKCRAVAFFTDCEHEVKPVEEGYRVALTFNVFFDESKKATEPVLPAPITESESKLHDLLKKAFALPNFTRSPPDLTTIGLILQHHYTMLSLDSKLLKGEDKFFYDMVVASGKFDIELTAVSVNAEGGGCDDDPSESPNYYYEEAVRGGDDIKYTVTRRNMKRLVLREKRRRMDPAHDPDEAYSDDSGDGSAGELLSEYTRNCGYDLKGSVYFVTDWRKAAVDKVGYASVHGTGNEGSEFELQYQAAAMLITLKKFSIDPKRVVSAWKKMKNLP